MMILAIDTSMAACSAAVIEPVAKRVLASDFQPMERGHAEAVAPMVRHVLDAAGLRPSQLDRIIVTTGPGTFTGVRIGLSMARGMGLSLSLPVFGLDSLRAIAANANNARRPILVAVHARNDEAYAALHGDDGTTIRSPAILPIGAVAAMAAEGTMIMGTAADAVMAAPGGASLRRCRAGDLPVAGCFGILAAGLAPPGAMPAPLYLRAPDARPQPGPAMPDPTTEIVSAGAEAADLLAALHAASFDPSWTAQSLRDLLATPGASAVLALRDGEPLGFLLTRRAADECEIVTLAILPAARRKGIARCLVAQHLAELARRRIRSVFLEVAATNAAARALYAALGFVEAGLRRGYYARADGAREDAIVMQRTLAP